MSKSTLRIAGVAVLAIAVCIVVGAVITSSPRRQVAIPSDDASPTAVVLALADARDAKDWDTAKALMDPLILRYQPKSYKYGFDHPAGAKAEIIFTYSSNCVGVAIWVPNDDDAPSERFPVTRANEQAPWRVGISEGCHPEFMNDC